MAPLHGGGAMLDDWPSRHLRVLWPSERRAIVNDSAEAVSQKIVKASETGD